MERLYRQLPWLDIEQARDYLQRITKPRLLLSEQGLLQLGRARRIDVYVEIDPRGLTGTTSDTKEKVTLTGMQQVLNPDDAFGVSGDQTCVVLKHGDAHWIGMLPGWSQKALFKSADILALADKMNAESASAQMSSVNASISSDAAFGATIRQQRKEFACLPRDGREAMELEHQRWRDAAEEIKQERSRPVSVRQLANLVKERLCLSDSSETIRKRL